MFQPTPEHTACFTRTLFVRTAGGGPQEILRTCPCFFLWGKIAGGLHTHVDLPELSLSVRPSWSDHFAPHHNSRSLFMPNPVFARIP